MGSVNILKGGQRMTRVGTRSGPTKISKVRRKYYKVEDINWARRTHGTTGWTGKCGNDWIESNAKGCT